MTYEEIARRNKRLFAILETHPNHQQAKYELEQNLDKLFQLLSRARHKANCYQFVRVGPGKVPRLSCNNRKTIPIVDLETGKHFSTTLEAARYFGLTRSEIQRNLDKGRFYK